MHYDCCVINIVVIASDGTQTFSFPRDEVVVGSAPDADLVLDYHGVAKRHIRLALRDRVLMVEDLLPTRRLTRAVDPIDIIRIANVHLRAWLDVSDEAGQLLLDEIRRRPDDAVPRTVYADWLEQHGHPERAEFLRQQLAVGEAKTASDPDFVRAAARLAELASKVGDTWRSRVAMSFIEYCPSTQATPQRPPELGLELVCPMRWDKLMPTDREDVRSCSGCNREVTYCTTIIQARTVASRGGCLAVDPALMRSPGDLDNRTLRGYDEDWPTMPTLGMPSPIRRGGPRRHAPQPDEVTHGSHAERRAPRHQRGRVPE